MAAAKTPPKKKEVLLGVSGGIAAYRVCEVISLLREQCAFTVVMTPNATRFVTPLTFKTLTQRPVIADLFEYEEQARPGHIAVTENADLFLVAPATANVLAKLAHGIADDALTTTAISLACPVLIAPAMNPRMWSHRAVQANVAALRAWGYQFVEPTAGHLACGDWGVGRLAEPAAIVAAVRRMLALGGE
ncbi:MAG: hypothetical protein HY719_09295 [Planctomycetes bacterium]|nr:hypothetical protein [Planctomycetota bacterium]